MKHKIYSIIFFLITVHSLFGRSEMTQSKYACNMVELAIWDEFLSEGKKLPSSWDEIPSFQEMKKSISTQNPDTLKHLNALALVPNAPIIQAGIGISSNHSDLKLFAISRTAEFHLPKSNPNNESSERGRYAIFVAADGSKTESNWILESEVQLILKQIDNFDPEKQSLAFDNVDQVIRDKKQQHQLFVEEVERLKRKHTGSENENSSPPNVKSQNYWLACAAGLITILAVFILLAFRKRLKF